MIASTLILGSSASSAHTIRYGSDVSAAFQEVPGPVTNPDSGAGWDHFLGRVTSPFHPCEAGRTVRVFRTKPPSPAFLTTAGRNGVWKSYREDPANGTYYARAARRVIFESETHLHVCRAARSPDFAVTGQPDG